MTVVPLRPHTIRGSEAAAACDVDPYRSRVMLWLEKTGRHERPETEAMRWGIRLQPVIAEELEERGYTLLPAPADGYVDPARPWLVGHPDGFVGAPAERADVRPVGRGLLEIKTVGQWAHRANGAMLPLAYAAQVQTYLHLTGLGWGLLAMLVGGQRLDVYPLPRDDRAISLILPRLEEFYGYLCSDTQPPVGRTESDKEALMLLHPHAVVGRRQRADKEALGWYHDLLALREQESAIGAQRVGLENALKAALGDAEILVSPDDRELVRWAPWTSTHTDVKGLRAAHPDIAAQYVTTKDTRRFTLL